MGKPLIFSAKIRWKHSSIDLMEARKNLGNTGQKFKVANTNKPEEKYIIANERENREGSSFNKFSFRYFGMTDNQEQK